MKPSKTSKLLKKTNKALKTLGVSAILFGGSQAVQASGELSSVISLQAEASKLIANDEMFASLYVEEQHANPTTLAKNLTNTMNAAMATAKKYPDVKVSTGSQRTHPVYEKNQEIRAWRGRAEINLNSKNFEQTGKLIAQLQKTLKLSDISFKTSDATREAVENELMIEASKKFQQRAKSLLGVWSASDYKLVELNLNTNGIYQPPVDFVRAESMSLKSGSMPSQDFEGGESKITVTASGKVQLK